MGKKDEERSLSDEWLRTKREVDDLDKEFKKEYLANFDEEDVMEKLRQKLASGEVDVKVMQVGPDGKLTDVSDRVNPKNLRADQISGIQSDGRTLRLGRNPQSREEALGLLKDLLGFNGTAAAKTASVSIQRMERALEESDKILEHWKK